MTTLRPFPAFPCGRRAAAVLGVLLLASGIVAHAEDEVPGERSPGDMTVEERTQMMQATNDYNGCVYKAAMDKINADPDIRRIADAALVMCQPQLDGLRKLITGWKFPAYFADGFSRQVRDRAVHNLLPELATRKGG